MVNYSSSHGTVKCMFKNNIELRISLRQTDIRVQYLSIIASGDFEFSKKSIVADLTHFLLKMRILLMFFWDFS